MVSFLITVDNRKSTEITCPENFINVIMKLNAELNDIDFDERLKYLDGLENNIYSLLNKEPKFKEKATIFSEVDKFEKQIRDTENMLIEKSNYYNIKMKIKKTSDIRTKSVRTRILSRRQIRKGKVRELRLKYSTIYRENYDALRAEALQEREAQRKQEIEVCKTSLEEQQQYLKMLRLELREIEINRKMAWKKLQATDKNDKSYDIIKRKYKAIKKEQNRLDAIRSKLHKSILILKTKPKVDDLKHRLEMLTTQNTAIEVAA